MLEQIRSDWRLKGSMVEHAAGVEGWAQRDELAEIAEQVPA